MSNSSCSRCASAATTPATQPGRQAAQLGLVARTAAQLTPDADALDQLLDDRLVFTGPDGSLYDKNDDLELQRCGQQRLTEVTEEELRAVVVGDTGVTWFRGRLAGQFKGEEFSAHLRYTRTWINTAAGWRLLAAHVNPAA